MRTLKDAAVGETVIVSKLMGEGAVKPGFSDLRDEVPINA